MNFKKEEWAIVFLVILSCLLFGSHWAKLLIGNSRLRDEVKVLTAKNLELDLKYHKTSGFLADSRIVFSRCRLELNDVADACDVYMKEEIDRLGDTTTRMSPEEWCRTFIAEEKKNRKVYEQCVREVRAEKTETTK